VRNPIKATAREPINRPDTYERFPKSCRILDCEQQPTHTFGPGKARMLAAMLEPVPELMAVQAEVERMARRVGMQPERRVFRPHVTLVRFGRHMSEGEAAALQSFLSAPPVVDVPVTRASSFSLRGSTLTDQGARYEALAVYPLG
jgi:2'-5' RNA ligase